MQLEGACPSGQGQLEGACPRGAGSGGREEGVWHTGVFRLVDKKITGMREMNLEL